jgi:three-Cys-motif partner protein
MSAKKKLQLDQVGYWSEVKLDVIKEYAAAYSTIMSAQREPPFHHLYIDAFAGAGIHESKSTGDYILGSPLNALNVHPPFREYHFIDLDEFKVRSLEEKAGQRDDVFVYHGDCNEILIEHILPRAEKKEYKRALCVLDPYGLHLNWGVVQKAGEMGSIEIFYSFQIGDANRNVLWQNPDAVPVSQKERLNASWGDTSWEDIAYTTQGMLFGDMEQKAPTKVIAEEFRKRLKTVAGFKFVPEPIPMRNSKGVIIYYMYFASPNETGAKIVNYIFNKYRSRRS